MRITGGELRSRAIRAPKGSATRPTSDRVREALFSVLASRGALRGGVRVLDLYAGTGALAFEALSRGAEHATLVEDGRDALAAIRANVASLGLASRVTIAAQRVERCAAKLPASSFDLVFVDPPYALVAAGDAARAIASLASSFAEGATVVLEHATLDDAPDLPGLVRVDARRYGDTSLALYAASK